MSIEDEARTEAAPSDTGFKPGVTYEILVNGQPPLVMVSTPRASQPVQVEVTDEMVEKAMTVLVPSLHIFTEDGSRNVARAALSAALGGGDSG